MKASNIHFEMAERGRALNYAGIGAIHLMGQRLGLAEEIDSRLQLLKRHLPYHESDHVLNLAYNALLDGQRLEDIELRRNDEAFLDGLGAQRIPDPTTSGDFTRRFNQDSVWSSWKPSTRHGSVSGRSNLEIFSSKPLLTPTARWPGRWESAKGEWLFPIKGSGVTRL